MKKIYMFRHGRTSWNDNKNIPYSEETHDVFLNDLCKKQAQKNALRLKNKNIQYVYTSKLKRAFETGKILANFLNINHEIVNGLEEFSIYDDNVIGLTRKQIKEKIGLDTHKLCMSSKDELLDWRPLNCETKREARNRIVDTVNNICKKTPYDVIGIASHGAIIKELLKFYDFEDYSSLKNCEIVEMNYDNYELKIIRRIKSES